VYKRNTEARSRSRRCRAKAINITYSEYGSTALVIQQALTISLSILPSAACLAQPYLPHYLMNGTVFGKIYLTHNECFDFLYIFV